jgi:tRNA(adenine34) deaminase
LSTNCRLKPAKGGNAELGDQVHATLSQPWSASDERFMRAALELACKAASEGEIPIGAVVVSRGSIVGEGSNRPISSGDPTWHAEIEALRHAAARLENYRLPDATLYVTLEPCVMCAGAIVAARIERLVFAARDIRFGAVRSKFRLADSDLLNHRARVEEGLFAAEAADLLANFFRERRGPGSSA